MYQNQTMHLTLLSTDYTPGSLTAHRHQKLVSPLPENTC